MIAGPEGRLVTNDELRDHVFQMLPAPRLFYKWKERHQVRGMASAFVGARGQLMLSTRSAGPLSVHAGRGGAQPSVDVHNVHPRGGGPDLVDVSVVRVRRLAVREAPLAGVMDRAPVRVRWFALGN